MRVYMRSHHYKGIEDIALQYDVILAVQLWGRRSKNLSYLGVQINWHKSSSFDLMTTVFFQLKSGNTTISKWAQPLSKFQWLKFYDHSSLTTKWRWNRKLIRQKMTKRIDKFNNQSLIILGNYNLSSHKHPRNPVQRLW